MGAEEFLRGRFAEATGYKPEEIEDGMEVYAVVDSVKYAEICSEADAEFGVHTDNAMLGGIKTFGELARYVESLCAG